MAKGVGVGLNLTVGEGVGVISAKGVAVEVGRPSWMTCRGLASVAEALPAIKSDPKKHRPITRHA